MKTKSIKFLSIIPARKGSKRIKNKNKVLIKKKNLLDLSIENSLKSKHIDLTLLSTNYLLQKKYKNKKNFLYLKRPKSLCKDNSNTEEVVLHALKYLEDKSIFCENIILLQPTSPFRNFIHIDKAIKLFKKKKFDSLFSAYIEKLFIWKKEKKLISHSYNFRSRERTQVMKGSIIENGAIFIFNVRKFKKIKNRLFGNIGYFRMSKRDSLEIDTLSDLKIARKLS